MSIGKKMENKIDDYYLTRQQYQLPATDQSQATIEFSPFTVQ